MKLRSGNADRTRVKRDATVEHQRATRIWAITVFTILVMSSISGAAFAQLTRPNSVPDSIGQFDTELLEIHAVESPDSMAFTSE
jgi:hypothetical protein